MTAQVKLAYARMLDWLMRIGLVRAVMAITLFSIATSVVMTGAAISVFMPATRLDEWIYLAIICPLVIAPTVGVVIMSLSYQLAEAKASLASMAETDPLTGIGNRRRFISVAEYELARAKRDQTPLSVLMFDIDHFKRLNDRHGHATGDAVLVAIAARCAARLRRTDVVSRWGGEEFVVLLAGTALSTACSVAESLRAAIAELPLDRVPEGVTISIGVAQTDGMETGLDDLLAAADRQLYAAKAAGRNQIAPMPGRISDAA